MARGTFWSMIGTLSAKFMIMLAGIFCVRILGKEIYGQYGMIKSTINLIMVIGGSGLGLTATKYISQYKVAHKERIPSVYGVTNLFAVVVAFTLAILVFLFADFLSIDLLHEKNLIEPMKIGALILFMITINLGQEGVLAGFEDFKSKSINLFIGNFIQGILMVLGAYHYSLVGAVIGYGMGVVLIIALNKRSINKNFKKLNIHFSFKKIDIKDLQLLYRYSLPATISTILAAPTFWLIRTILVRHTGGFGEVAIFDVSDQWKTLILFIPAAVCQIALPILSSIDNDETGKFWRVLNLNILINVSVALVMAFVVACCSPIILSFYGEGFRDNWPMIILALSCIFTSISTVLGVSISSLAKMWTWCTFNTLWAIVLISLSWLFVGYGWGAKGVALAVLLSYMEHAIVQYVYLKIVRR